MTSIDRTTSAGRMLAWLPLLALPLVGCDSDSPVAPDLPEAVTIQFAGQVNGAPFVCGQSYAAVGTAGTTITPTDFRLYVHDVRLLTAGGQEVPVELNQDGTWQRDNLAMLDFENGQGPCSNGTPATRTVITGEVAPGQYTGIRFVLGVPFEHNHRDITTAPAPQDLSAMFWAWNSGYKFLRFDHTSPAMPDGWFVHLGSTGCTPTGSPTTPATACANANRMEYTLTGFDWKADVIVADVGSLLQNSNVTVDLGGPRGCMSGTADPECPAIFGQLGLPMGDNNPHHQTFFRVK